MTHASEKSSITLAGLFLGAGIGLGVLGAGYFAASAFKEVKLSNQTLTVKGYAQKDVMSDYAQWSGRFRVEAATREDAFDQLQVAKQKVTRFLQSSKVSLDQVGFSTAAIYPNYVYDEKGNSTGGIRSFSGDVMVSYGSKDVTLVQKLTKEAQFLIKEGVAFETLPTRYLYSQLDDLKIDLLGTASEDAKARADAITSKAGSGVGALLRANQGVFQITARNDTSISGYGVYDTMSVEKTVTAVVTLTFQTKG